MNGLLIGTCKDWHLAEIVSFRFLGLWEWLPCRVAESLGPRGSLLGPVKLDPPVTITAWLANGRRSKRRLTPAMPRHLEHSWSSNLIFSHPAFSSTVENDTERMRRYGNAKRVHPPTGEGIRSLLRTIGSAALALVVSGVLPMLSLPPRFVVPVTIHLYDPF